MKTELETDESQQLNSPEVQVPCGHDPQISHPIMDEEDAAEDQYRKGYQEAARIGVFYIQQVLSSINSFKGDGHFAARCAMAAHGLWSGLRERDQVEIAEYFAPKMPSGKMTRANVFKLIGLIQKRLDLPPALGQRSIEGCENMSKKRKSQLRQVRD